MLTDHDKRKREVSKLVRFGQTSGRNCKAVTVLVCFIASRYVSPCAEKHGVATCSGGTSYVHISKRRRCRCIWRTWIYKNVSWHATQVPCVKLRASIAAMAFSPKKKLGTIGKRLGTWRYPELLAPSRSQSLLSHSDSSLYLAVPEP